VPLMKHFNLRRENFTVLGFNKADYYMPIDGATCTTLDDKLIAQYANSLPHIRLQSKITIA